MATVAASRRPRPAVRATNRKAPPLEHRVLVTATLVLIAYGAVMVYSASSPLGALNGDGFGTGEFIVYLGAAGLGLAAMRFFERFGLSMLSEPLLRLALLVSFLLLLAVLVAGKDVNNARRWVAFGPIQFQPSEVVKVVLILYAARYLADHPRRLHKGIKVALAPLALVVVPACALIYLEPDLGTALVIVLTIGAMLSVAGIPMRYLGTVAMIGGVGLVLLISSSAYQRQRLTSFLHPSACAQNAACFQAEQGEIAIGSGGFFGVGLGQGVSKDEYLPEAQSDFILAIVGEELGVLGILGVVVLYGMIAFAGLRTARKAATRYAKLVATGLTSLILCQGLLNIFVVLGIAPLTGVPLPFISYAPTSLVVLLASVGVLLNIARPSTRELRAVSTRSSRRQSAVSSRDAAPDRDRRRRDSRARGARASGRRRAAG
jgi:cell division protein FtsW